MIKLLLLFIIIPVRIMQANGTDRYLEIYIVQFLVGKSNEGGKIVRSEITLERGQIVSAFS